MDGAPPGAMSAGPAATYGALMERQSRLLAAAERSSSSLQSARVAVFLLGAVALVAADLLDGPWAAASLVASVLLAAAFFVLVGRHRRAESRARRHRTLRALATEGLLRLARDWDGLASLLPDAERSEAPADVEDHPYAADLHLYGRASLMRLAGPVTSAAGRRTLRGWLSSPAGPDVLELRRAAVGELAGELDFRMELACLGRLSGGERREDVDALLEWAAGEPSVLRDRAVRVGAWLLPPLSLGFGVLQFAGGIPALWVVPFLLQLVLLRRVVRRLRGELGRVSLGAPALRSHGPQLRLVEGTAPQAELLRDVARRLDVGDEPAHERLERLGRLADIAESRRNLFYQAANPFLLLDAHLGMALDRWRERSGAHVGDWIGALGEMEALAALACVAYDHPDWTFPQVAPSPDGEPALRARALGHPLIRPDRCVRNDVDVGPPGTFLLVTGSNMSGKSTLLRAIGANVVLAGAGGPACAEALELPTVRLHTSLSVTDSLEDGVSRFMAELLRVRGIVESAREAGPPVLFLLDELLQGTNTAERKVAARAILEHLLRAGAIGAVTTHDLALHEAPELVDAARARHFRETVEETVEGTRLDFDYRLRPGLATTRNALRLLQAMGLGPTTDGEDVTR